MAAPRSSPETPGARRRTPRAAARDAKRELARLGRPAGNFDASRYFRGADDLKFYNVGTDAIRALARSIHAANRGHWSIRDATAFADVLMKDRYLEVKSVGIELVARYRREFGFPVRDYYARAVDQGLSEKDVAAVYAVVAKESGVAWCAPTNNETANDKVTGG